MKCTDFELRLQCLFDERGTLDGDAELQAHALTCAECQSLVETYELLFDGVKARAAHEDALVTAEATAAAPGSHARSHRGLPWAAAAAVLLAVGYTTYTMQQSADEQVAENQIRSTSPVAVETSRVSDQPAVVAAPAEQDPLPAAVAPTIVAIPDPVADSDVPAADVSFDAEETDALGLSFLESPADEYAGLYRATGRSLAFMLRSIRPMQTDSALTQPATEDPAGSSWRKLHSSIEPLTDSMTEALEELLRGKPATPPAATADRAS